MPLDDIEEVMADADYLSRHNYDLIEAKGAKPYIKIKRTFRLFALGSRGLG